MTHHIILGGGVAAVQAVEAIRQIDDGGSRISLISSEPVYKRALLPRWLAGQISKQDILTASDAYFAELKVDRYLGAPAVRINANARTVSIRRGQTLPFDDLLIATGSSPIMPAIPGIDLPGVQPLWTIAHVEAILEMAAALPANEDGSVPQPAVVILGGGFIGLTIVNALVERGWPTQVVEMADRLLPRILSADAASVAQEWLIQKGVGLHCGVTVQQVKPAGKRKQLLLSNGQSLEADLVIVAVGRKPNLELARGAGIRTERGILVNELLQTNFPNIYAAGDVVQTANGIGGTETTASEQGRVAGANMAGQEVSYRADSQRKVDCWPGRLT